MANLFQDTLKDKIGNEDYGLLKKEAEKEVALSLQMPLTEKDRKNYYRPRFILEELLPVCDRFHNLGLQISPLEVVTILFKCKLLFAVKSLEEYTQRCGMPVIFTIADKAKGDDILINNCLEELEQSVKERVLLSKISHLQHAAKQQSYFESLFEKIGAPFECYLDRTTLIKKYQLVDPNIVSYSPEIEKYFQNPSIGFRCTGSRLYVYWVASSWLRSFFNVLRIASFINPGMMHYGAHDAGIYAPNSPVFLASNESSNICWNEDAKKPWAKVPDGSLFLSFGYRANSRMILDERNFASIGDFIVKNRMIFDRLRNPWSLAIVNDVSPSLDILSSATQIPDLGAKILLLYCCLEHLFVPKSIGKDNNKYITGGINALKPDFIPWFDELYRLRCDYAHKGYVIKTDKLREFVRDSMGHVFSLMIAKLGVNS